VPKYREAFFSALITALDGAGISCRIAAAAPQQEQAERGDAITADWIVTFKPKQLHVSGRTITLGGARHLWRQDDAVVVGHLGSSLDTYRALFDAVRKPIRVGLWGHIKSYVNDGNPLDLALERWQLRRSDHVFAYTPGGRDYAISSGVNPGRVTAVMNATDTTRLETARDSISESQRVSFMAAHNLIKDRTLGYIGGLDSSKRIDFLAEALERLWVSDPDVKLIIGGSGSDAHLLDAARSRGQAVMLGYASPLDQALIAGVSSALLMPGRIGLVAVDALVLRKPILTTAWPYHAPEHEYLTESMSRFTSANNEESYASLIHDFLAEKQETAGSHDTSNWDFPTIDKMVDNFSSGIVTMLEHGR
jgi:glycosyltransferase involved in cell wall biosynthesis